jgi:hypothetical protein
MTKNALHSAVSNSDMIHTSIFPMAVYKTNSAMKTFPFKILKRQIISCVKP